MKYSVITFGCRVNQADSLGFEEELLARGATAASPETADLVVVNTCSVTANADQGARQVIRRVARDNPSARIVVTGCYATRRPDEVAALPNVIRIVPNDDKPTLISVLRHSDVGAELARPCPTMSARETLSPVNRRGGASSAPTTAERFGDGEGSCGAAVEPGVAGRTAFTLRVQTGCAEPCSYCIIPATRGFPRSVPLGDVLREVERIAAAGFKEIALTGVHLGSYGRDLMPRSSLVELLRALDRCATLRPFDKLRVVPSNVEGRAPQGRPEHGRGAKAVAELDVLFRISSLEPMDCSRDIVDLVASSDRFAPHFHLPLQHASDRVLAGMRRPYTIDQYSELVADIRNRIPHASIGSDIIVGFPGETDSEFAQLASYLERSPLTHIHVFPYSDRPGTAASTMRGKVGGAVVRDRARRVREIGRRLSGRFHDSQIGTTHRALTLEDGSQVVTGNYLKLRIPPGRARNEWVTVRIARDSDSLYGELIA